MEQQKVTACIVTYGGFEEAAAGAQSILDCTKGVDLTLYLVDNASPDGTGAQLAQRFLGDARVQVIQLPQNVGFGSGHNAVLPLLQSEYHFVINPDITLQRDALSELADYLNGRPEVAMAAPRLVFPTGEEQYVPRRRPTVMGLLARQLPLGFLKKYERHYLMRDEDLTHEQEIGFCSGCFFVVRTAAFRAIGGFDEDYFMYVEDADITQKARAEGKIFYWPGTWVCHAWHRNPSRDVKSYLQQLHSMGRYFRKWGLRWGFSLRRNPD